MSQILIQLQQNHIQKPFEMVYYYLKGCDSVDLFEIAKKIAYKYMEENPENNLSYRPFYSAGVVRGGDYRYRADMNRIFPLSEMGDSAELKCVYISDSESSIGMAITLFGTTTLFVNGEEVFKSDIFTERNNHIDNRLTIPVKKGVNEFYFKFKKTALGFGCIFGTHLAKWDYIFMNPLNHNMEGCIYRFNGGDWLPEYKETEYCLKDDEYAVFYTKDKDGRNVLIKKYTADFPPDEDYVNPFGIEGFGAWAGLFPLKENQTPALGAPTEGTYWRLKYSNMWVRPYYNTGNFGRWNYPLGVVMYGLMRTGQLLEDEKITNYAKGHIQRTLDTFKYALWDKDAHGGAASLHNLLSSIDSLDDCGAFCAAVEEATLIYGLDSREICDFVADYIENKQPRNSDGSFSRQHQLHSFHNETMWLDDMYMSVPFLVRRYKITGKQKYLDDAANQFKQYKKWLYMEDRNLMSHVYDLRHSIPTGVPWGRGNGWFLFSMSELLAVLPESHPDRKFLESFFKTLSEGYLAHQSSDGRWRQVIDDEEAYLETSCSAMFAASFMRGFRMGLLGEKYATAARRAVDSIVKNTVDEEGNLYGVCRGSEFSFSNDYYKYDLLPRDNDTHGIGIVLLAIFEVII